MKIQQVDTVCFISVGWTFVKKKKKNVKIDIGTGKLTLHLFCLVSETERMHKTSPMRFLSMQIYISVLNESSG